MLQATGAVVGDLTSDRAMAVNTSISGQIRVSMASQESPTNGSGALVYLEFNVVGEPDAYSALSFAAVTLNGDAINVNTTDGTFGVDPVFSVGGDILFWHDSSGVPGVQIDLQGIESYSGLSNESGAYMVKDAVSGDYVVSAKKWDDIAGLSVFDASLGCAMM